MAIPNSVEFIKKVFKSKVFIIGILGVLVIGIYILTVSIPNQKKAEDLIQEQKRAENLMQKQYDNEKSKDIGEIILSLTQYANDHNNIYPLSLEQITPNYIKEIPTDSRTNQSYKYNQLNNGEDFNLCTYVNSCKKEFCFSKAANFFPRCDPPYSEWH